MKAILVIDVDERDFNNDITIIKFANDTAYYFSNKRLKPMPEKKNEKDVEKIYSINDRSWTNGFSDGYNYCIDELLGEE